MITTSCCPTAERCTSPDAPAVFVHGSGGSGLMWRRYAEALGGRRIVTPDLIGYGRARPWPTGARFSLDDEVARLRELLLHDGQVFHLVGYSYGGAVALSLAAKDPGRIASLALIEPVAFFVLRYAEDASAYAEAAWVRDAFFRELERGRAESALRDFIEYWMGPGAWDSLTPASRDDLLGHAAKIRLDWEASFGAGPDPETLRRLRIPTLLVHGSASPRSTRRVIAALGDLLPATRAVSIEGANHLLPFTHAPALSSALLAHWSHA